MIPGSITVKNRFEELDFVRGLAIVLMIVFHLIVDLKDLYSYNLEYLQGFWYVEGKLSAMLFIFLCGLSSTLSHNNMRHGIIIFSWAMLLTTITYAYNADFYIRFGILHLLGISLLLTPVLHSLQKGCLLLVSTASLLIGLLFSLRYIASPYFFPLGLQTSTFASLDYYPLFPWYGVFVAGVMAGKQFYTRRQPLFSIPFPKTMTWLGRHSLAIYLIHQPILVAFLYVIHRN
jgi:uncharacterized membrane protein